MTSEQLTQYLQTNTCGELVDLENFTKEFPYVASAQQLLGFAQATKESLFKGSIYQGNPYLFIHHKNGYGKTSIETKNEVTPAAETEVIEEKVVEVKVEKSESAQNIDALLQKLNEPITPLQDSEEPIFTPLHAEDYFLSQGIAADTEEVTDFVLKEKNKAEFGDNDPVADDSQILVTMSFSEWLQFFKEKKRKEEKENEEKQALRAMWQKQKLSLAMEEENDVVPEAVFNQAMDSINLSDNMISESFADILFKQGKKDRAEEMYRKLSLLYPEKSAYFATKLKNLHNN